MQEMRRAGWLLSIVLLASASAAVAQRGTAWLDPSYIKLEEGTWAVGGLGNLLGGDEALILVPDTCVDGRAETRLAVGFAVKDDFIELRLSGSLESFLSCEADIGFRNFITGRCDSSGTVADLSSGSVSERIAVDSDRYKDEATSRVELCLVFRCGGCLPPPTDKDAVSARKLNLGPTPD